ncbi:hypothetical protein ANO11243_039470 [Dothideomycetidae sp. 11243]|nr:hypothetical protein ANO11243_039470 [fungal sp. No.11243]
MPQNLEDRSVARAIVPKLLSVIDSCNDERILKAAMQNVKIVVKDRKWLMHQHNLEALLCTLERLCSPSTTMRSSAHGRFIYTDICNVLRFILQFHRPSLGGRLHIVIPILERLMACLFVQIKAVALNKGRFQNIFQHPPWLDQDMKPLLPEHAELFNRVVGLLCNPPQSTLPGFRMRPDQPRLTDPVREARMYVSGYVPNLIHVYCHYQLHGVPGKGIKEALTPAVFAMFDVLDLAAPEDARVIALGASMGKAQLALLRREHAEWKQYGRWRGI